MKKENQKEKETRKALNLANLLNNNMYVLAQHLESYAEALRKAPVKNRP